MTVSEGEGVGRFSVALEMVPKSPGKGGKVKKDGSKKTGTPLNFWEEGLHINNTARHTQQVHLS